MSKLFALHFLKKKILGTGRVIFRKLIKVKTSEFTHSNAFQMQEYNVYLYKILNARESFLLFFLGIRLNLNEFHSRKNYYKPLIKRLS